MQPQANLQTRSLAEGLKAALRRFAPQLSAAALERVANDLAGLWLHNDEYMKLIGDLLGPDVRSTVVKRRLHRYMRTLPATTVRLKRITRDLSIGLYVRRRPHSSGSISQDVH